ncbi:MAG: phosphotransferase [Anaerolineae bacterium]
MRRKPATPRAMDRLLAEQDILPPGRTTYELVSEWAAKHVWRVLADGECWAFIRYLLGPASEYPDRWRHLRLSEHLYDARVGPRILGVTPESEALDGRAAIVEACLRPIERDRLERRNAEAIGLFTRLHGYIPLHTELSRNLTEADRAGVSTVGEMFAETHERWFDAVVERWLGFGLGQINDLAQVVGDLLNELEALEPLTPKIEIVVPCHNDPNHGNFMLNRQGALRLIDFETLALNNPVADIGVYLTWYVDRDQHVDLLRDYPLADADVMLARMKVWVPLRYLNIAAHWAARLTRADDAEGWEFAVLSIDEWLTGACELIYDGYVLDEHRAVLDAVRDSLLERSPE